MPRSARSCSWGAADSLKRRSRLREYSRGVPGGRRRRVILSFFRSPIEILGTDRVEGIRLAINAIVQDDEGNLKAVATGAWPTR
jgi:hypothetical protein